MKIMKIPSTPPERWRAGKLQYPNNKWFDKPFDRLTVLSKVEGLTTLSPVESDLSFVIWDFRAASGRQLVFI
jgi:hypothetical protein